MRVAIAGALLLAGSAWAQGRSIEGAGRISVAAGARYVDKSWFAQHAADQGTPMTSQWPVGLAGVASFAYGATPWLEAAIDVFGGYDRFAIEGDQPFDSTTYGVHVVARMAMLDLPFKGLSPWLGVGGGPTLVLVTSKTRPAGERAQMGVSVTGGFTFALTDAVGIAFDVRWIYARSFVPGISGINAGGVWATVGLVWQFAPEPKRDLSAPGF